MSLHTDPKKLLAALAKLQPYLIGLILVGLFGYTAWAINAAVNVAPSVTSANDQAAPHVSFDQKTIDSLKQLEVVNGDVPTGGIGKNDPFN